MPGSKATFGPVSKSQTSSSILGCARQRKDRCDSRAPSGELLDSLPNPPCVFLSGFLSILGSRCRVVGSGVACCCWMIWGQEKVFWSKANAKTIIIGRRIPRYVKTENTPSLPSSHPCHQGDEWLDLAGL